ncbi:MAG: LamG domain-containing protein [Candidatus Omnitrophica bacterium]|nr:LamG domain-containing protein [Candidatus Omnitrophota bacterium]
MNKIFLIIFLFFSLSTIYSENKYVLYYNFDEVDFSNKIVFDLSGYGNNGKIREAEICEGINGKGVYFNGKGSCIIVPYDKLKEFSSISIETWVSPEEIRHSPIIYAADNPDYSKQKKRPFDIQWRGPSWFFWFYITTKDGEERLIQPNKRCVDLITFPKPTWYHLVVTYDGQKGIIYLNGKEVAKEEWKEKKSIAEINEPILIGTGYTEIWNSFKGKIDEFKIYNYALTEEEVLSNYLQKEKFKPFIFEKRVVGTIDGKPYFPIGYEEKWVRFPLEPSQRGCVYFSNTGEVGIQSGSGWSGGYGLGNINIWGQLGRGANFYKEIDGVLKLTPPDKEKTVEISGITYDDIKINQKIVITPENEIKFKYEFEIPENKKIKPCISWPIHLWPTALSFVGYEKGEKVKGRLIDLSRPALFENILEVNLSRGGNRFILKLSPDLVYQLNGTRNPINWLEGWTTFSGLIKKKEGEKIDNREVLEFSIQIIDDSLPPLLSEKDAKEITEDVPFDFSKLYEAQPQKPIIEMADRETPIFGIDEEIKVTFKFPNPSIIKEYPKYVFLIKDAYSEEKVYEIEGKIPDPWWDWLGRITFIPPRPSVYIAKVVFYDRNEKIIDTAETEIAVCGPILQKEIKYGEKIKLELVDSVDFTKKDPGHNFYSSSDKSEIVKAGDIIYRRTLSLDEVNRIALNRRDWFGCTLTMKNPKADHIVEVIYADLDDTIIGINILEPCPEEEKKCLTRVATGIITGGIYKSDGKLKSFKTVYIPTGSSSWCAITFLNLYKNPIGIAKVNLYEIKDGLPKLPDLPNERLIGVYTEGGDVGLGTFGYNELAGEFTGKVPMERFYKEHYKAIENLIRYMRFTGENVYIFGVYRYRNALFPSKYVGSGIPSKKLDLPALMAKMFEYNNLKLILNVQTSNSLPVARLYRYSNYDLINGAPVTLQVSKKGRMDAGHFGYQPSNPFNPDVIKEYKKFAEELAERYGKYKSIIGISWLCGAAGLGEPSVFQWGYKIKKDDKEGFNRLFFNYTYDDITIKKFEEYTGIKLLGEIGNPNRFKERYESIMNNLKEKWIEFRCWAMSEVHKELKEAFVKKSPDKKYLLFDYYGIALNNEVRDMNPIDIVRLACSNPKYYKNIKDLVYCPYIPTIDASQFKEYAHGLLPEEWIDQIINFARDEKFAEYCDTGIECGKFLHRQFFETFTIADPYREWVFTHCKHLPNRRYHLAHNTYPQPNGENWFYDFVLLFRYSTPNFISYMWCDGSFPSGHFEEMQKFTYLYRQLPIGKYKTVKKENGVYLRKSDKAFYIIETEGKEKEFIFETDSFDKEYINVLTGKKVKFINQTYKVKLNPYDFLVFIKNGKS